MKFEWDSDKESINIRKHGLSFSLAARVFYDPNHIELFDDVHSVEEDRFHAIGLVDNVLTVVFTERGENIRIISARCATEKEKRMYYEQSRIWARS